MMPVMLYKMIIATAVVGEGPSTLPFGLVLAPPALPFCCKYCASSVMLVEPETGPFVFKPLASEKDALPFVVVYSWVLANRLCEAR